MKVVAKSPKRTSEASVPKSKKVAAVKKTTDKSPKVVAKPTLKSTEKTLKVASKKSNSVLKKAISTHKKSTSPVKKVVPNKATLKPKKTYKKDVTAEV